MPQLFLLQKTEVWPKAGIAALVGSHFRVVVQVTDVMTWHYVFCMGMYRAFYLLNWVWRYMTQVRGDRTMLCVHTGT